MSADDHLMSIGQNFLDGMHWAECSCGWQGRSGRRLGQPLRRGVHGNDGGRRMTLTEYRLIAAVAIIASLWLARSILLAQDRWDRRHRLVAHYDAAARERVREAERAAPRAEAP